MKVRVRINGTWTEAPGPELRELLRDRGVETSRRGVAVAVNGEVVPRSSWHETELSDGDEVEIVHAVQGG